MLIRFHLRGCFAGHLHQKLALKGMASCLAFEFPLDYQLHPKRNTCDSCGQGLKWAFGDEPQPDWQPLHCVPVPPNMCWKPSNLSKQLGFPLSSRYHLLVRKGFWTWRVWQFQQVSQVIEEAAQLYNCTGTSETPDPTKKPPEVRRVGKQCK